MTLLKKHQEQTQNGVYDKRNQINKLTGKEWLFSTRSVKTKNYNYYFELEKLLKLEYIDFMPIELHSELVLTFTKPNTLIIDPFCNFGSVGYATELLNDKREFFGFLKNKHNSILASSYDKTISPSFTENSINEDFFLLNKHTNVIILSELIFSTLNLNKREREYANFENILKTTLEKFEMHEITLDFIVISIQNTKCDFKYINNSQRMVNLLRSFNYVLKGEIIWKIPENEFRIIKKFLSERNEFKNEIENLLNDKRILVFRGN